MNDLEKAELKKTQEDEAKAENDAESRAEQLEKMIDDTNVNIAHMEKLCGQIKNLVNGDFKESEKLQGIVFFNAIKNTCNAITLLNNQLTPQK